MGKSSRVRFAARDPTNTQWQRDVFVGDTKVGNALVAQGDGPGALAAYRKSLATCEALGKRDRTNTRWQTDLASAYASLGTLDYGQTMGSRRAYLERGRDILLKLKSAGRLRPNQDWTLWFAKRLSDLEPGSKQPRTRRRRGS
jgi:hypothetical protein